MNKADDPTKPALKRTKTERDMLNFCPEQPQIASSACRLKGLIATSFLGSRTISSFSQGSAAFFFDFQATQ